MSTLEATVQMLSKLSEPDLLAVQGVVKALVSKQEESYYKAMTEEELMDELALGRRDAETGKMKAAETSVHDLREKYGL